MDISYTIDHAAGRITLTGTGAPDAGAMLDVLRAMIADPDFSAEYERIWDMRDITAPLGRDDVTRLVRGYATLGVPGGRVAFVMAEEVHFGIARMFASMAIPAGGVEFGVFRSVEEADDWFRTGGPR